MKHKIDYTLYLVTDRSVMKSPSLEITVEQAIKGGVTVTQLREKHLSTLDFYNLSLKIKKITDKYGVPLIINDRLDIAQAIDSAGVHVGQDDMPVREARRILGDNKIIGISVTNLEEALRGEADGADYFGIGAMYNTSTKTDANIVTMEELDKIIKNTKLPKIVIGGINKETAPNFAGIGVDGIAVASAIMGADDVKKASEELRNIIL